MSFDIYRRSIALVITLGVLSSFDSRGGQGLSVLDNVSLSA